MDVLSRNLRALANSSCTLCPLHAGAANVCVPGEGSGLLPVLILGEAPGREEDARNIPFCGASGKLLRSAMKLEKIPYEKCYITNSVKCYPHGTPKEKEIAICTKNYLHREISLLSPNYILAVGKTAFSVLNPVKSFAEARGKIERSWLNDALVFPVWHPAYILRNRSKESEWRNDLSKFKALLEVDLAL